MTRRSFWIVLFVPALLWLGHTLFTRPTLEPSGDFLTFVAAGRGIGEVDVYSDHDMAELWRREFNRPYTNRYIYPPVFAAAMSGFADGDLDELFERATTINLALIPLFAGLLIVLGTTLVPRAGPWRVGLLVAAALSVNVPLLRTLAFTQVNLAVVCAVSAALLAASHRRVGSAAAGASLAIATSIKIAPVVLLAPVVLARRGWTVIVFGVVMLALGTWTVAAFGIEPWTSFLRYTATHPGMPVAWNTSIDSLVFVGAGVTPMEAETSPLRGLVLALKVLVGGGLVALGWRRGFLRSPHAPVEDMLFLLPIMLLVSPYAWPHGHLFVLPTMVVAAARSWTAGWGVRVLAAATYATIFLVPVIAAYPWSFVRTVGVIALVALVGLVATQRARRSTDYGTAG